MKISDSHLTPAQLIDAAEDPRGDLSIPHLSTCDRCRRQLADVRAAMAAAGDAAVPEPSPLFWAQFSRRVSDAVAADETLAPRRWFEWARPRAFIPASVVALAAIFLAVMLNPTARNAERSSPTPAPATASATIDQAIGDAADFDDDSSLNLVADLTAGMDLNVAIDAGLTSRDSAEHAVTHMSADELRALERLLKDAIARDGA